LQGNADYESESKEEGVFQEQLSPHGRIFDKNSKRGEQNQVESESAKLILKIGIPPTLSLPREGGGEGGRGCIPQLTKGRALCHKILRLSSSKPLGKKS